MKAVIFDMDGLMIDSERLYFQVERDIAGKFNRTLKDETLWKMMGKKPIESLQLLVKELDIPISAEDALAMRNIMMREKLKNDLVPMPGLEHIIGAFYKRLKMAISTGASREFLDLMLDRLNIRDRFDVLITSDEIEKGKPDPEIYLKTCQKLALKPEQCVVLEDSSNGARAGKRAGCYVIAVPSEYTKEQDFSFVDFIAGDLFAAEKHIAAMAA
jgi:HAD superfamily hydrolase (TIGR01509 family)